MRGDAHRVPRVAQSDPQRSIRLDIAASSLSFHLKELLHSGLVSQERDGRHLIYRASFGQMDALLAYLTDHCCEGQACAAVPAGACAEG